MLRRLSVLLFALALCAPAAFASQAALVVNFGNTTITECVTFDKPVITAFDLLQLSGLTFTSQEFHFGQAICSIQSTGCQYPSQPCFCQADFWTLFLLRNGVFEETHVGASHLIVHNGDVIAFSFGNGTAPTAVTFEQVCGSSSH